MEPLYLTSQMGQDSDMSSEAFPWQSRLRYYWTEDTVELRMMHSKVKYGYEYLSAYTKLVMTPLTERCYRILLMALDLHQGGLVSGQTATGTLVLIRYQKG